MPIQVLMPALSPTMEKGNLAKWLKAEGDQIKAGDVIAEIETDKATMEVEAVDEGTLGQIAVILSDGEDRAALTKSPQKSSAKKPSAPAEARATPASAPRLSQPPAAAPAYDASNEVPAGTEFATMTVREALRDA